MTTDLQALVTVSRICAWNVGKWSHYECLQRECDCRCHGTTTPDLYPKSWKRDQ